MYSEETNRGAQWLKWDCHIHTPYSYHNKFTKFQPGDVEDESRVLDIYVEKLKEYALKQETNVVVINDYFTLDGYRYITENYCERDKTTKAYYLTLSNEERLYILPGIELRIDNFTDNNVAINMHLFFNQKLTVEQIEENFLCKLKISKNDVEIELTKDNLIRLGMSLIEQQEYKANLDISMILPSDKSRFLKKAYECITLNYKDIVHARGVLESKYWNDEEMAKNCCVIVMPFKGHGSIGEVDPKAQWDGRRNTLKLDLMRVADIFYAPNLKDIQFVRGELSSKEHIKEVFGNIKPCIWGSDAHEYETMCHPSRGNSLNYTWIKGKASFDGLKQTLLEPYDRVYIGENYPNPKMEYKVIDSIKFIGDKDVYPNKRILLNEALNTVVGGKSSGKSLLLNCIASAVNGSELFDYTTLKQKCGFDFDFEVKWKSGDIDKLNLTTDKRRKVKYVSQMYAADFVENSRKLDQEVFNILMEDREIADFYTGFKQDKERIDSLINNSLFDLENHIEKHKEYIDSAKKIGELNSLERESKRLIEHKEKIIQESQMTENELEEYRNLLQKQSDSVAKEQKIKTLYIDVLNPHINYIDNLAENTRQFLEKETTIEEDELDTYKAINFTYKNILKVLESSVDQLRDKHSQHIKTLENIENDKEDNKNKLRPYEEKMKQKEALDKVNEDVEKLEKLKKELKILITLREEVEANINESITTIVSSLQERIVAYKSFIEKFNKVDGLNMDDQTQIICEYKMDKEALLNRMRDMLNNTINENKTLYRDIEDNKLITEDTVGGLNFTVGKILKGYHWCKDKYNHFDLIRGIIKDYYVFKFDIVENETSFFNMSPGKKGLIILKLILHMSTETYPILLDQPEDNLDNRTISTELQKFIKDKKINRQIIMVTHNANLAILTDSEEIIVANQRGADKKEQESVFDYVSGPLELSFLNRGEEKILYKKGVKEHVCDILEGGVGAFKEREARYQIDRMVARRES